MIRRALTLAVAVPCALRRSLATWLALAAIGAVLAAGGGAGCATSTLPRGAVSFRVEANVPDATVWIDDQPIGTAADWAKPDKHIRAGFHRIEVRHPGYYSFFQEIELPEGQSVVVHAELRELIQ